MEMTLYKFNGLSSYWRAADQYYSSHPGICRKNRMFDSILLDEFGMLCMGGTHGYSGLAYKIIDEKKYLKFLLTFA